MGGDRPSFSCLTCNKTFLTKSYLEKHKTIHSGEEPYSCTHCDKRFTTKGNLKQHENIHSGEKPFSCSICKKTFIRKDRLKQHEKVCNKTFIQNDALEEQEMTQKGEEPYQHFTGPEQAVKLNRVDASSSQKVYSQRDPAMWLNVKQEPVDEDSHPTIFDTDVQQPTESKEDIEKVQVKEEFNFEEVTIKEEFIPDE